MEKQGQCFGITCKMSLHKKQKEDLLSPSLEKKKIENGCR